MQAHPELVEYALGQHSGLNSVVANMLNSPSGRGMGCEGRPEVDVGAFHVEGSKI
jgi:hypothetical protein